MSTDEASAAVAAPWRETAWTCSLCGHCNLRGEACEVCGVALRFLDDPPLDLPYTPRLSQLPSFWLGLMWSAATLAGAVALLSPSLRASIGEWFLLLEVAGAGAAAASSLFTAFWERLFNRVELSVPPHAAAGSRFEARLKLVPYRTVDNVTVRLTLRDRFYQKSGSAVELRSSEIEAADALRNGRLPGRRQTALGAWFLAPFPVTQHTSVQAEMSAGLLSFVAPFLPAARFAAANLREHGGYYVEAHVRVGLLSRRYHKRVLTYAIGSQIHVG